MSTSAKAKISIETGRTLTAYAKMTDGGAHDVHYLGTVWSGYSSDAADYGPDVRPNGMVSGRNVLSLHATDDTITIAGFTAYSKGTEHTVVAATGTFTRGTGPGKSKIISVTMDSAGTIAIVPGEEGADTTFSAVRDAAGGPPYIPVNSVEIGQIRVTSSTAGALTAAEIFQVVGTNTQRFDYPTWEEFNIGKGILAETAGEKNSHIKFDSVLPAIHTGGVVKEVFVQYYTPSYSDLSKTLDFKPCENSPSVSSTQYYNGTIAAVSRALGTGGFTAIMANNVSDALLNEQDKVITVKFYPDRNKNPFVLTQGEIGVARTFPVADQNQASVIIASENASVSFLS